jgi:hypothetical protein
MCYTVLAMKRSLLCLIALAAFSQTPYRARQDNVEIFVLDWSNRNPLPIPAVVDPPAEVRGVLITACSDFPSDAFEIRYTRRNAETGTIWLRNPPHLNAGYCGTALVLVPRAEIASLSVQRYTKQDNLVTFSVE